MGLDLGWQRSIPKTSQSKRPMMLDSLAHRTCEPFGTSKPGCQKTPRGAKVDSKLQSRNRGPFLGGWPFCKRRPQRHCDRKRPMGVGLAQRPRDRSPTHCRRRRGHPKIRPQGFAKKQGRSLPVPLRFSADSASSQQGMSWTPYNPSAFSRIWLAR